MDGPNPHQAVALSEKIPAHNPLFEALRLCTVQIMIYSRKIMFIIFFKFKYKLKCCIIIM
jgi:hypothetical protein